MDLLLRKLWGSVPIPSSSSSRIPSSLRSSSSTLTSSRIASRSAPRDASSTGPFDRIPTDVMMLIFRFVDPKDAGRARSVCRTWSSLLSDNQLWLLFIRNGEHPKDSIVFAETHLRSGIPSVMYFGDSIQLSFLQIYAQREKVPGSVIVDGGSGYCKYGWSKYPYPSGRCATFLEFGNIESPVHSRLRHFFMSIYSRMDVRPSSRPIIVSMPLSLPGDTESAKASRRKLKEAIYSVLFDMNALAVCAIDQATLALYAVKRTSGIVVHIGFRDTSIVPIVQGKVLHEKRVHLLEQGALKLTGFLKGILLQRNISFASLYTVRTIKEKLCYVAADYDAELRKDSKASCEVSGEGLFTLSKERFQTGEILFQPQIAGLLVMSLHQAVALCMSRSAVEERINSDGWYKTIVLAGGTACLPGLAERLEKELHMLLPASMSEGLKVIPPPHGVDTAWFGAKIVSNVSTFSDAWCVTKEQYRQKSQR